MNFNELEAELQQRYYGWDGAAQFKGTGDRLRRAFEEFCVPSQQIEEEIEKAFQSIFVCKTDEMLVEGPINVWTLCPHHLLPCHFTVYVGYIPGKSVLGLSKFARVAVALGRRPIIQEMYTEELAETIQEHLAPRGVGVYVIGQHMCMQARGIKQQANVTTASLLGTIRDRADSRAEFYAHAREGNGC